MRKSENYRKRLTATLWFLPTLLAVCGGLLGLLMVALDTLNRESLDLLPVFFGIEPSGATTVLSIIAGSIITVTGTVYSITIVALTLASTQFSPRILRNFMRDTGNQFVLGVLVGIFGYCLMVVWAIRTGDGETSGFVPIISVIFGSVLGLIGVGVLIYFIHHVAVSIQATSIISTIAQETIREVKKSLPLHETPFADKKTMFELAQKERIKIPSEATGYIQNTDYDALLTLAEKHNLIVQIRRRIGEFTIAGLPLLQVSPQTSAFELDENLTQQFNDAYDVGNFRTVEGDIAFGLRQIVDIALKALSPAINDSTTGVSCIDYLTAILVEIGKRPTPSPHILAPNGNLRVVIKGQRFEDFFDLAFNQIRQSASGNVAVIRRLINSIDVLAKINAELKFLDERRERFELLNEKLQMLEELAKETITIDKDLEQVLTIHKITFENLRELQGNV